MKRILILVLMFLSCSAKTNNNEEIVKERYISVSVAMTKDISDAMSNAAPEQDKATIFL